MKTQIQIPVSELRAVLPGLSKVTPRSSSLPVIQCLKFRLEENGSTLHVQAHNLEEIATVRLTLSEVGTPGTCLVPLDTLNQIVKGCSAEQSVRIISSGSETQISYPVADTWVQRLVPFTPAEDWPQVKDITQEPLQLDQSFKEALREALECASSDATRFVLNGACVDARTKDSHCVIGTDGKHLYCANSFAFGELECLIVRSRRFLVWPGFMNDGVWNLRVQPAPLPDPAQNTKPSAENTECSAWFQIQSDRWTYVTRAIDGQYPNWRQVVPSDTRNWTKINLELSAAKKILNALPLLPGGEELNKPVVLAATTGLVLRAKGKDQSCSTVLNVPDATVSGAPVQVALNRSFLVKALEFGLHRIEIHSSLEPLLFRNAGKTMVVMPLRMDETSESTTNAAPAGAEGSQSKIENATAVPPSALVVQPSTEERKIVPIKVTPDRETPRPENNNHTETGGEQSTNQSGSAFKRALERGERLRAELKQTQAALNEMMLMLKSAEKEQRASAREIEAVRVKLKEIQTVKI